MKILSPRSLARPCSWVLIGLLAGCSTQQSVTLPSTVAENLPALRPGLVAGYLPRTDLVNSLTLLPGPPALGSPEHAADDTAYSAARKAANGVRWQQAARDAELRFPQASSAFSCALGVPITPEGTPHLNMLMRRTLADAGLATYRAKDHYKRQRPFMAASDSICTPAEEASLRKDGSYPSGHASLGWAWGLVLTEVSPERANALAQRAYAFGQSRVACGVHWQSDVDAGRLVASAVVAQLHSNADFVAQLGAARKEVAAQRAAGAKPTVDCNAESRALGGAPN